MCRNLVSLIIMSAALFAAAPAAAVDCPKLQADYAVKHAKLIELNAIKTPTPEQVSLRNRLTQDVEALRRLAGQQNCDTTQWPGL